MRKRPYKFRHTTQLVVVAAWLAGPLASQVDAQDEPRVRIRATTRIELDYARTDDEVSIAGSLLDDLEGPLPGRSVELRVSAEGQPARRLRTRTDARGRFAARLALPRARYRVLASFEGDDFHAACEREQTFDLERHAVALRFEKPAERRVNLDQEMVAVVVRADTATASSGLGISLRDELDRELGSGRTDASGRLELAIAAEALGPPALGKLVATSGADERRAGARTELSIVRYRPTRLELEARRRGERSVVMEGILRDSQGGLSHRAVGLFDGERHLATVLTNREGRFKHEHVEAGDGERVLRLSARFAADAPWVQGSASRRLTLVIEPAPPPHASWLIVPMLATVVALWLATRRARPRSRAARPRDAERVAGIHAGSSNRLSLASLRYVQGYVVDAATDRPLGAARVRLTGPDDALHELAVGVDGSFHGPQLADGGWTIEVAADGYAILRADLAIPHRGEWTRIQVRLQSLRGAAYQAYRPAALAVLANPQRAAHTTPSETLDTARRNDMPTSALARLTRRIERAIYDRRAPDETELEAIAREASETVGEIRGGDSGARGS